MFILHPDGDEVINLNQILCINKNKGDPKYFIHFHEATDDGYIWKWEFATSEQRDIFFTKIMQYINDENCTFLPIEKAL